MTNVRKKFENLNSKQVLVVSIIISVIIALFFLYKTKILYSSNISTSGIIDIIIISSIVALFIFLMLFLFFFKGDELIFNENFEEIKNYISEKQNESGEVEIFCRGTFIFSDILENISCKFFAKVENNGSIYVIAYDYNNKLIFEKNFYDYGTFIYYFSLNNKNSISE